VDRNSELLLKKYGQELKEHGIWIVTKTYTSTRCAVGLMRSKSSSFQLGLKVEGPNLFALSPSSLWGATKGEISTAIHEDPAGAVVFMSGIQVTKGWMGRLKAEQRMKKQAPFRGDDEELPEVIMTTDGENDVELELEYWGRW
jgi:hypothetical protein